MSLSLTQDNSHPANFVASGPSASDIQSMAATLTSYGNLFGPHHPQTLAVMAQLGRTVWKAGDAARGRKLLERAAQGLSKRLPRAHPARMLALNALGELLFEQRDFAAACLIQREVLACRIESGGAGHPDTAAAERDLAGTLLQLALSAQTSSKESSDAQ